MKKQDCRFFFISLILFCGSGIYSQSGLDSLLEKSYDRYSNYNYPGAILFADSVINMTSNSDDSINLNRARFYREIAYQIQQGDAYDIRKIENFEKLFEEKNLLIDQARARLHLARIYYYFGNIQEELAQYLEAFKIYEELDDQQGMASVYSDLSLMYYDQHDYDAAFENIRKAIEIDSRYKSYKNIHRDYNNLAIIYEHTGPADSAIAIHLKALDYAYKSKEPYKIGLSLSNLGNNYSINDQFDLAKKYLYKALEIRDSIGNDRGLAYTHQRLGHMYIKLNQFDKARYHAEKAISHAENFGELKVKRMAYQLRSKVASNINDYRNELYYFKKAAALEDSLQNFENTREITKMIMLHQFDQKELADSLKRVEEERLREEAHQAEIRKKNRTRNILLTSGSFLLIIIGGLYNRWRYVRNSRELISQEKDRSENLLLNILPAEVAEELKTKGRAEAKDFDLATILFTDFVSFTQLSEKLSATELVEELNICFEAFDHILEKYNIEKIKTIGDAYMAAGGLPIPTEDSVKNTVLAALEMQDFMRKRKKLKDARGEYGFVMRAGIHSGPVVAGIVGIKKFQYDLWGDTVNTASRMESNGTPGKVNISKTTYDMLRNDTQFDFEARGKVQVKGKGEIEMFYVEKNNESA